MNLQLKDNEIKVSGRIDSTNAADFENQLFQLISEANLGANSEVKLDFDEVVYISSAGLRVLLKLVQKKYIVRIENVSDEVYDIFEVTGFTQLLTAVKKIKALSLDGCEMIGAGATGCVYKINDELIIKVFHEGISREIAEKERLSARVAFISGVPTAIPFELIEINGRYGLKYELINGMTLGQAFSRMPEKFDELITKYVDLVKGMTKIEVANGELTYTKDTMKRQFARVANYLNDDDIELVNELLDLIPQGKTFVHADLQPGNIMVQNGELLLIDMADVTIGPDYMDLVQIYLDLASIKKKCAASELVEKSTGMKLELVNKVWDAFIKKYFEGVSKEEFDELMNDLELLKQVIVIPKGGMLPDEMLAKRMKMMTNPIVNKEIRPNLGKIKKLLVEGVSYKC